MRSQSVSQIFFENYFVAGKVMGLAGAGAAIYPQNATWEKGCLTKRVEQRVFEKFTPC